jgi:hypothetical protein
MHPDELTAQAWHNEVREKETKMECERRCYVCKSVIDTNTGCNSNQKGFLCDGCWEALGKPAPAPLFTAKVECWSPKDKLPDYVEYVSVLTERGDFERAIYDGRNFYTNRAGLDTVIRNVLFWHYPIKQLLQIPAPWRECVKGSMPDDVGYEESYLWMVDKDATPPLFCLMDTEFLDNSDNIFWAPYGPIDPKPIEDYIKAKEGEDSD